MPLPPLEKHPDKLTPSELASLKSSNGLFVHAYCARWESVLLAKKARKRASMKRRN